MLPVIIPIYGRPHQVQRCIEHLTQQTLKVDIFIRDNNGENVFFTKAVNEGIRQYLPTDCRYIIVLNQDMYLEPNAVEEIVAFMDTHPQCGIGMPLQLDHERPDYVINAGGLQAFPFGQHVQGPVSQFTRDEQIFWANGAGMILRKDMIHEIGLFDESLIFIGSDSDYCFTARSRGWQIWRIVSARGIHEFGASGIGANDEVKIFKIKDMLTFGQKWLTCGLYKKLAYEGPTCTMDNINNLMGRMEQAMADLRVAQPE